jgi:dihydrodipicolinate synthase/N-acetylneuraminate lyase
MHDAVLVRQTAMNQKTLKGNYPILPTAFNESEDFDETSQRNLIDYIIHDGAHGVVTLANASEGFSLSDEEKKIVADTVINQVNGRMPVVVTISHPSTRIAVENAKWAEGIGADALLALPPFYGSWIADAEGIYRHFSKLSDAITVPLIIQDHPLSGGGLTASLLVRLARELEQVQYFKIETARAALKIRDVLKQAGDSLKGIFGGAAGITFIEEMDQGACGTMPSSSFTKIFSQIYNAYVNGDREESCRIFSRHAQLIAFEWELGGRHVAKQLLFEAGIIKSPTLRSPIGNGWDEKLYDHLMKMVQKSDLAEKILHQ